MKKETLKELAKFVGRIDPGSYYLIDALDAEIAEARNPYKCTCSTYYGHTGNCKLSKPEQNPDIHKKMDELYEDIAKPSEESVGEKCNHKDIYCCENCKPWDLSNKPSQPTPMFSEKQLKVIESTLDIKSAYNKRVIDHLRSLTK